MKIDWKDILSNSNKDIDNQQLMDYLSNQLSHEDKHELEKLMNDDSFVNDAMEGLQNFNTKKEIQSYVSGLNNELHQQLAKRKKRKEKLRWKDQPWVYLAIILILILLIICFVVVKRHLDENALQKPAIISQLIKNKS